MTTLAVTEVQLAEWQSYPLERKVAMSLERIRAWYEAWEGQVYVAFSGGKDSTVLLHLVRSIYPEVPAIFANTGMEWPEVLKFVRKVPNVEWLRPKMPFNKVIEKYGYPVISKKISQQIFELRTYNQSGATIQLRLTGIRGDGTFSRLGMIPMKWQFLRNAPFKVSNACCRIMKKKPAADYVKRTGRYPIVGTMASDGKQRSMSYLMRGCNLYDAKAATRRSAPMSFWLESDVWEYIRTRGLEYSSIYDLGYPRTGCIFCAFGAHLEPYPNRFIRMQETHPRLYRYCMDRLGMRQVLSYCGIPYEERQLRLFDEPATRRIDAITQGGCG